MPSFVANLAGLEPILERNKMLRSMPRPREGGDWAGTSQRYECHPGQWSTKNTRAATRPGAVSKEFDDVVQRKLNDPDWAY